MTTLIAWSGFNSHPDHVVASLDKGLYDDYFCLVSSNKRKIYVARSESKSLECGEFLSGWERFVCVKTPVRTVASSWVEDKYQRLSPRGQGRPRGHILKSLAVASKVKSLALRPQVLENWPVLGSRTAVFFELLKFCGALEKFLWRLFFFGEHLRLCPWSLALASSIPVLGLESVCPRKGWPWPRIFVSLASSLVSSTPPLINIR